MSIYNLEKFGEKLKDIRKNLNLSQNKVTEETGVTERTIRNIENGKVLPSLDTLEILSAYYKTDLIHMLLQYRLDDYSVFYHIKGTIESKIENYESAKLHNEFENLKMLLASTKNMYFKNVIKQLIIFTEAIIHKDVDYDISLKKCIEAIRMTTPTFTLENYKSFAYSPMEIRILMNIALIQNGLEKRELCLDILNFCIYSIDPHEEVYSKICCNLAYSYQLKKDFENMLKYADLGIKACQESRNYYILTMLFYLKGFAQCKLNDEEFRKSLETAICLCDAFNKMTFKKIIISDCDLLLGIKI